MKIAGACPSKGGVGDNAVRVIIQGITYRRTSECSNKFCVAIRQWRTCQPILPVFYLFLSLKMPPKKKPRPNKVSPPTNGNSSKKKSRRKAIFSRTLNQESPPSSPEVITMVCQRPPFIPPSPPRAVIRSLRRTLKKPTCNLCGPHRETLYSDYFFCANCKAYDDYASSGSARRIGRDSTRFRCTANHTDFFFPKDRLMEANSSSSRGGTSFVSRCNSKACSSGNSDSDESMEDSSSENFSDDRRKPAQVSHEEFETVLRE